MCQRVIRLPGHEGDGAAALAAALPAVRRSAHLMRHALEALEAAQPSVRPPLIVAPGVACAPDGLPFDVPPPRPAGETYRRTIPRRARCDGAAAMAAFVPHFFQASRRPVRFADLFASRSRSPQSRWHHWNRVLFMAAKIGSNVSLCTPNNRPTERN
jgi:hypothetical protein